MDNVIYALGFFDGVHIGHQALLAACRSLAAANSRTAGVITFDAHPDTLVAGRTPRLINTPADRERLLKTEFHMQTVVTLPFDEKMRSMEWEDFLSMLRREHGAAGFVCGEDFRFGFRGLGNAAVLGGYCLREGLPFAMVPQQEIDGIRVSSTYIRQQLETGDMATAVRFLGHPHILTGTVVHGRKLGRTLGIPTANLRLPQGLAVPRFGVYVCSTEIDGCLYPAVTNIGNRPTVNGHHTTVEPWILDFSGDLYGRELSLRFHYFLRPEMRFDSLEDLQAEIRRNAEEARNYLKNTV